MSDNDIPEAMKPVAEAVKHMNALFEDAHPGLISWNMVLGDVGDKLYTELVKAGFDKRADK